MHIGVMLLLTDETASPFEVAAAVEERGFESLFVGEHTHMPAFPQTEYPGERAELPPGVNRTFDPWTSLLAASTATTRLRLGTAVTEMAVYDPILLAKVIATVDRLSGGRLIVGSGYGWNVPEIENHGVAFKLRREVMHEKIEAMTAIWTHDIASYSGEHVSFEDILCWPKPLQSPRPPMLLGATGPKGLAAMVRYFDGWMPTGYENLVNGLPLLRQACEEAGRDVDSVPITVTDRHPSAEHLAFYAEHGIERLIVSKVMTQFTSDRLHDELDAVAALVAEHLTI